MSRPSAKTLNNNRHTAAKSEDDDDDSANISNSTGAARAPTVDEICTNILHVSAKPSDRTVQKHESKVKTILRNFDAATLTKDATKSNSCDARDVGTIVRALNLNPTEATVMKIVEDCEEDESTGYIKYEKLLPVLMKCMLDREYAGQILEREDEQMLRRAFRAIDRDGKGWIEVDTMKKLMMATRMHNTNTGNSNNDGSGTSDDGVAAGSEPLTMDEMDTMIQTVVDPATGKINVDDYITLLMET